MGGGKKTADYLLIWLLISFATHLSIKFVIFTIPGNEIIKQGLNTFIHLAYGPILWMYTRKVADRHFSPIKYWYLFIPTFVAAVCYLSIVIVIFSNGIAPLQFISFYNNAMTYLLILTAGVFGFVSWRISKNIALFWSAEVILIKRLSLVMLLFGFIVLGGYLMAFMFPNNSASVSGINRIIVYSLLLVAALLVIQYKIRIWHLVSEGKHIPIAMAEENNNWVARVNNIEDEVESLSFNDNHIPQILEDNAAETIRKSTLLSPNQQEEIFTAINKGMERNAWFLDSEYSLEKLSKQTGTPKHHITEALNKYGQTSFTQWINEFRIDTFKKAIQKCVDKNVSPNILMLAFDAGFNSKSGFNYSFKKQTGQTPSEFYRVLKQNVHMSLQVKEVQEVPTHTLNI
jgi:AraC-like DNA-binding protein